MSQLLGELECWDHWRGNVWTQCVVYWGECQYWVVFAAALAGITMSVWLVHLIDTDDRGSPKKKKRRKLKADVDEGLTVFIR